MKPQKLFDGPYFIRSSENGRHYDVASDGRRFLMLKQEDLDRAVPVMIVQGWAEELKRRVR